MRTAILLSLLICVFVGCGTTKVVPQPTYSNCTDFISTIKNKWKYESSKNYYKITLTEKEYNKLITDNTCLVPLNENDILNLFGKPTIAQNSNVITKLYYPITPYFSLQKPQNGQTAIIIEIQNHKFLKLYDESTVIKE